MPCKQVTYNPVSESGPLWARCLQRASANDRALLVPVGYLPPGELPDAEFPFFLTTGRQMYHWHTGAMTRRSDGLDSREPRPNVEMHPDDASTLGVEDGEMVRVASRRGEVVLGVRVSTRQAKGQLFIPMHYREAAANLLTNPKLDPYAKIAEFKIAAVRVAVLFPAE